MLHRNKSVSTIAILVLLAVLASACSLLPGSNEPTPVPTQSAPPVESSTVISEGRLAPREDKTLGFLSAGEVAEVLVAKGDLVSQGQVLARLTNRQQTEAAIVAAELEVVAAQQAYDDLVRLATVNFTQAWQAVLDAQEAEINASRVWEKIDTDETQQKIDDAEISVADAKKVLDDAQENFDKYKDLPDDNETRKDAETELEQAQKDYDEAVRQRDELIITRDRAEANLASAQAVLAEAEFTYANLENGPDPDQLALAQARLTNANTQKAAAEAAEQTVLDNLELKAPFAGTIVDVSILPGQNVAPGTPAFLLADFSEWFVETTDLTELEVVKIDTGQAAIMLPDALNELELTGEVIEISQVASLQSGDVIYTVRIRLDEPAEGLDSRLRWGMTMEVTFPEK